MKMTHGMTRIIERCPGVCPGLVLRGLIYAWREQPNDAIEYIGKYPMRNTALYGFDLATGDRRFAVIDEITGFIITVLLPEGFQALERGRFDLENECFWAGVEI